MKRTLLLKSILLTIGCFLIVTYGYTQANWEVNAVRNINPQVPSNDVWKAFSSTAKPVAIAVPLGMAVIGWLDHDKTLQQKAYETAGSLVLAAGSTYLLKLAVNRPRPYQQHTDIYPDSYDDSKSFPSGHVSMAFATAASLSLQCKKWYVTVPAYAWGAGVAYSRLYLGQHYPTDVIAGAAVGAGSAYLAHWLNKKLFKKK